MKKCILVFMALVMLTCSLASPVLAENDGATTLEWFIDFSALPSNWNMNEPIFAGITEKTGVQCALNIPAEDAGTKLNLLMVSGKLPDLITISNGDLIAEMIASDMVWDLEELLKTYVPDSHLLTAFPEDIQNALIKRDGGWYSYPSHMNSDDAAKIYGYPNKEIEEYYKNTKYDNTYGIYLYKEYVDKLGIDVEQIKTEKDLMDTLAKIDAAGLTNESGASVYTLMTGGIYTVQYTLNTILANTFGAMTVGEDGNYHSLPYSDEYRDAVSFLNNCAQKGYLSETQLIMDEPTLVSITNSGRCASFIGGLATLRSGAEVQKQWVSVGSIVSDTGTTPVYGHNASVGTGWLSTFVSKKAADPEACARFIDYMASLEGLLLHMYGVEGVDYTYDANGCLRRTETGSGKIEDGVTGMFGFYAFHNTAFGNSVLYKDTSFLSPTTVYPNSDDVVVYDSSVFEMPSGYVASGSDMAFIKTETDNFIDANIPKLILASDGDAFQKMYDDFLTQLDKLGRDKYDAYMNEQFQKNCENKGIELKPIN